MVCDLDWRLFALRHPTKFINLFIQDVHISLYVHFTL